ncbi:14738_t:CDS:2, partial [Acaulospora morrowiae]
VKRNVEKLKKGFEASFLLLSKAIISSMKQYGRLPVVLRRGKTHTTTPDMARSVNLTSHEE